MLAAFGLSMAGFTASAQEVITIQQAIDKTLSNNLQVKQAQFSAALSNENYSQSRNALLPSVNGNASHSWNIGLNVNPVTNIATTQTTQYSSLGVNANVDIYKGLQNQNAYRRATLSIIASKYQLLKMQEDISLNVANAFLQILSNKEDLKVKKEQLAIDEKRYTRSEEMVNAGTIPRGDLFDLKATVATDKQNITVSENNLLISKLSLAQLLQLKEFADFDVVDDTNAKDENNIMAQTPIDIYNKAKETRTELKLAQTNLEIAEKNVSIAKV